MGQLNMPYRYKAVSNGKALADAAITMFAVTGQSLLPYSPVHIEGVRNSGPGGDLDITWVRRTRIDGSWRDLVDAGLGEYDEQYEVRIYDSAFAALKWTYFVTSPSLTYSAADQSSQWGSPVPATVGVRIYQVSTNMGRGKPGEAVL
jgi:hypothetical protein